MPSQDQLARIELLMMNNGAPPRMLREVRNRMSAGSSQSRDQVNTLMDQLNLRLKDSNHRAALSPQDLFGNSINRQTASVRENANNTKQALARMASISGGNITGAAGSALNRVDQNTNQSISDIHRGYDDATVSINNSERTRGDRLAQLLFGNQASLLNLDVGLEESARERALLQDQAARQRRADLIGNVLNIGSAFL